MEMSDQVADQLEQATEDAKRLPELLASRLQELALAGKDEGELYTLARDVTGTLQVLARSLTSNVAGPYGPPPHPAGGSA
jgi:hypothetical protein